VVRVVQVVQVVRVVAMVRMTVQEISGVQVQEEMKALEEPAGRRQAQEIGPLLVSDPFLRQPRAVGG
jgi:hypothetical protein